MPFVSLRSELELPVLWGAGMRADKTCSSQPWPLGWNVLNLLWQALIGGGGQNSSLVTETGKPAKGKDLEHPALNKEGHFTGEGR